MLSPSNETTEMHETKREKGDKKKERNEKYKEKIRSPSWPRALRDPREILQFAVLLSNTKERTKSSTPGC